MARSKLTIVCVVIANLIGVQLGILLNVSDSVDYLPSAVLSSLTSSSEHQQQQHHNDDFALAKHESFGFLDDISSREWALMKQRVKDIFPNVKGGDPQSLRGQSIKAHVFYQDHYEPDFACRHERRIGELGDGGKWVCDPHRLQNKTSCLVYSIGSNGDTSFETAVKKEIGSHCEIHVFDMADYKEKVEESGGIFHQWGVSDKEFTDRRNRKYKSLQETMQELGHAGRTIDIFKIDCESCEWSTFPAFFESGVHLQQVLIELHAENKQRENLFGNSIPTPQAIDFFEAMVQHGYVIYHKEVNIRWWRYGQCIEYGFLKLHPDFFEGIPIGGGADQEVATASKDREYAENV
jgi:hypothetical protein